MAKVGLNFGEKMQIVDKSYRVLNDGLVDLKEIFGDLSFRSFEETDLIYEDDMTQPRRQDGSYPQIPTGESRGLVVGIFSPVQLKYREPVELEGVIVTYSSVGSNQFKLFASKIKRSAGQKVASEGNHKQEK